MFDFAGKSTESKIKGNLALQAVNKAISIIGEKFDAYEQEWRGNKKNEKLNGRKNWRATKQDWSSGVVFQTKLCIDTWDCWE